MRITGHRFSWEGPKDGDKSDHMMARPDSLVHMKTLIMRM